MPVPQGFLSSGLGVMPGRVELVVAWQDGYEILYLLTKDTLGRRELWVRIRSVTVLEDGMLQGVGVEAAIGGGVIIN